MRHLSLCMLVFVISGCASRWINVHPELNPDHGFEWALNDCTARSPFAPGNIFNTITGGPAVLRACMKTYGYELRNEGERADLEVRGR